MLIGLFKGIFNLRSKSHLPIPEFSGYHCTKKRGDNRKKGDNMGTFKFMELRGLEGIMRTSRKRGLQGKGDYRKF